MDIMIADDEVVSRKKMEALLKNLGYNVFCASDGKEAWEMWQQQRTRIVIIDWLMPGMDGVEVCAKIRKATGSKYTYIIIVTSKSEVTDLVEAMDAGADDFITKPFVKEELAVRVRAGERILDFETRDLVIFSMAKLAESKDRETGNHLERISFYTKILAETLFQSENAPKEIDQLFIDNITLTSVLHDIGKIGIPDYILLKPGRLDEQEFEIMKNHSRIGFETLNEAVQKYPKAEYLKMSADIALYHHEKFDGTGYPKKLKGEEIPLAARITALADVYDALVSKRVYKNVYSHTMAKNIIVDESKSHFDPAVVDAFLKSEDKFVEVLNKLKEEGQQ
jgi:putative two-component system response regulator